MEIGDDKIWRNYVQRSEVFAIIELRAVSKHEVLSWYPLVNDGELTGKYIDADREDVGGRW